MMRLSQPNPFLCDVLVIGGGGAGLRAAIEAREMGAEVILVSKSRSGYGNNTVISKASFSSANGFADARDTPETMVEDAIVGGRFINDRKLVVTVAEESGALIAFLKKCGVRFVMHQGRVHAFNAPGHRFPRHARAEHHSGIGLTLPLIKYAKEKGVRFADRVFITRLIPSRDGRIASAVGFNRHGDFLAFLCNCMILATGGFAPIYLHHNNAPGITGDGQALAFELGIPLKDMEFVQFYPTASGNTWSRLILYEDLIMDNAVLRNRNGDDILASHGLGDPKSVTRDRLSRAIMAEIVEGRGVGGGVIMDFSKVTEPNMVRYKSQLKDSGQKSIVVSPTAHFCNGGVIINEASETVVPGLFAAGEVCGGVHGANRIAGNALSEVFTMGRIAGRKATLKGREMGRPELPEREITAEKARLENLMSGGNRPLPELRRSIKEIMWYNAGITRNGRDLEKALGQIEACHSRLPELQVNDFRNLMTLIELQNMLTSAEMVCRAALFRTESRGAHYRSDYPEENNDTWLKNIVISRDGSRMSLQEVPVSQDIIAP
jgi:succinate dehydrogenase/fumarate reductase flavoprotein subunit